MNSAASTVDTANYEFRLRRARCVGACASRSLSRKPRQSFRTANSGPRRSRTIGCETGFELHSFGKTNATMHAARPTTRCVRQRHTRLAPMVFPSWRYCVVLTYPLGSSRFGAKYRDLIQMAADLDAGLVVYRATQGSPALTSNEVSLDGFAVTKAQLRDPGWKATNKKAYDLAVKTRTLRVVD